MKKILCTLGPSSMNKPTIVRLDDLGVSIFRINLSHTKIEDLPNIISFIKNITQTPLCLDTEGAQIRNGYINNGSVVLNDHSTIKVVTDPVLGDENQFNLYPDNIVSELIVGDFISIDFDKVLLQVIDSNQNTASLRILNGGKMGQNKAVTINRSINLPSLTAKDKSAIKIGCDLGVNYFALSFANHPDDVDHIRALCGENAFIISKIESRNGVSNLKAITDKSDAILIDRGDLSREYPIERIPSLQKRIIKHSKINGTEVYVATNLLESMIDKSTPTRAEVNDVYTTLSTGADGLVLAAETAIGINPISCTNMIVKLINSFEADENKKFDDEYYDDLRSLLIEPHGGQLINRAGNEKNINDVNSLQYLQVRKIDLMDCEQIADGTYSPLKGFMDKDTLYSVLEFNSLPNGTIWTMPIILQINSNVKSTCNIGDRVALTDEFKNVYAIIDVSEIYQIDLGSISQKWFGTTSKKHPGVAMFYSKGEYCIAGEITLVKQLPSMQRNYQITPRQSRLLFDHKGWSRIVGFHTRNPVHRVHEFIQLSALETSFADGLYISPVIGQKKSGDFLPEMILQSYQILIELGIYPEGKVVLGSFFTYSRYSGPRETVFTMLCRKNMGCSHFIVGRDHAGVMNYYEPQENRRFIESLGDLGIKPIFFEEIGYSSVSKKFVQQENNMDIKNISGTEIRDSIRYGKKIPNWFMRTEVQEIFHNALEEGIKIFES